MQEQEQTQIPLGNDNWNATTAATAGSSRMTNEKGGGRLDIVADDNKDGGSLKDLVKAESMVQLALALPAGCLIGALAGMWLDKHFHTGWMGVAGILLGAVAGFVQIYRTASGYMKRGD